MNLSWFHLQIFVLLVSLADAPKSFAAGIGGNTNWVTLFNGKDLTGWTTMNDGNFSAAIGILHLEKSIGWLRTEKQYADFILEAEWRALETNYNSGFFIRAGLEGKPFPENAWQVNLKAISLGSLLRGRDTIVPSKTPQFPVNEWVTFRMEVRGKKLTLDVNGARAWEFNDLDTNRGYIGIQAEGKSFDFRNLRVQEVEYTGPAKQN